VAKINPKGIDRCTNPIKNFYFIFAIFYFSNPNTLFKVKPDKEPNILISFIAIYMFCLELRKMVVSSAN
jgi:hypothetical protein